MSLAVIRKSSFKEKYGPWAVVTGATSGIGRAFAVQLAQSGFHLVLVARRLNVLDDLARELKLTCNVAVKTLSLDLTEDKALKELSAATESIDVGILVAAAGFGTSGKFIESSLEREMEMLSLNCRTVLIQARQFGPRFSERGIGAMVLMGSIVGFQGVPGAANYAATKAYVQSFAEALNRELGPAGVDVVASAPGPTRSGFADRAGMKMDQAVEPDVVARKTLKALGKRSVVRPGFLTKFLSYSLAMLPRWGRVRVMEKVMKGMTCQPLETAVPTTSRLKAKTS